MQVASHTHLNVSKSRPGCREGACQARMPPYMKLLDQGMCQKWVYGLSERGVNERDDEL